MLRTLKSAKFSNQQEICGRGDVSKGSAVIGDVERREGVPP
jgi:hypothetical protein